MTQRRMSKKKIGTRGGSKISARPKPKNKDDMSKGKRKLPFKLT